MQARRHTARQHVIVAAMGVRRIVAQAAEFLWVVLMFALLWYSCRVGAQPRPTMQSVSDRVTALDHKVDLSAQGMSNKIANVENKLDSLTLQVGTLAAQVSEINRVILIAASCIMAMMFVVNNPGIVGRFLGLRRRRFRRQDDGAEK